MALYNPPIVDSQELDTQSTNSINKAIRDIYLALNEIRLDLDNLPEIDVVPNDDEKSLLVTLSGAYYSTPLQSAFSARGGVPEFSLPKIDQDGRFSGLKTKTINVSRKASKKGDIGFHDDSFTLKGKTAKIEHDKIDGNPIIQIGSSDTEAFLMRTLFKPGEVGLQTVSFDSITASEDVDAGKYFFTVDGRRKLEIRDQSITLMSLGTVTADVNAIVIENDAYHATSAATRTSIGFFQAHSGGLLINSGKITVGTEQNWTGTASTQDSYISLSSANNGTLNEHLKIFGSSVMFIKNVSGIPATPSGGGHLYVAMGALKYKGSSGTVTTLGAA